MREDAECLGMLQDGLNMPCKKFYNPVPKFEGIHEKKNLQINNLKRKSCQFAVSEMLNLLSSRAEKIYLDES